MLGQRFLLREIQPSIFFSIFGTCSVDLEFKPSNPKSRGKHFFSWLHFKIDVPKPVKVKLKKEYTGQKNMLWTLQMWIKLKLTFYLSSKAIGCQWVSVYVCLLIPNSSKMAYPKELKFWGVISLAVQMIPSLSKCLLKNKKNACNTSVNPLYHPNYPISNFLLLKLQYFCGIVFMVLWCKAVSIIILQKLHYNFSH